MISGAPKESRWLRAEPRRNLPVPALERMVHSAFPGSRVLDAQPLTDGLRNSNFKLQIESLSDPVVLRIYEHDLSLCQKELDLFRLVASAVTVPELIHAEPNGLEDLPPFTLARYVDAISFHDLQRCGDAEAIAQAADSVGEILAAIGRFTFSKSGWLAPGPKVTAPLLEGADPLPRFFDLCLASANLHQRMTADLCARVHELVWWWAPQLALLENEAHLVHCDLGKKNVLVHRIAGKWEVAAVLDWEFAVSGTALIDVGHFLRYERTTRPRVEPHFSEGYLRSGGKLARGWRQLARLLDLSALCESLTHETLPDAFVPELVELVRATVENRDPQLA